MRGNAYKNPAQGLVQYIEANLRYSKGRFKVGNEVLQLCSEGWRSRSLTSPWKYIPDSSERNPLG